MKKLVLLVFSIWVSHVYGQEQNQATSINIGAYAAYGIQPGAKVGVPIQLKSYNYSSDTYKKLKTLYIQPQFGFFVRPDNYTAYTLNADFGYKMKSKTKQFYMAPSVGVGYLLINRITSSSINLATGEPTHTKELEHYFLPTINYELGFDPGKRFGWYIKASYGRQMSPTFENQAFFAAEIGLKILIRNR